MQKLWIWLGLAIVLLAAAVVSVQPTVASTPPAAPQARTTRWSNLFDRPNGRPTAVALPPGSVVTIVGESAGWVEVQASAGRGWLPANAITRGGAPAATPASPPAAALRTTRWVNLHAAPAGAASGRALPPDTPLTLLETSADGNWLRVSAPGGLSGWLPRSATAGGSSATPAAPVGQPTGAPTTPPAASGPIRIVSVRLDSATRREARFTVFYENSPAMFIPQMIVRDMDNCIANCQSAAFDDRVSPIVGIGGAIPPTPINGYADLVRWLENPATPARGSYTVRVTIDGMFCTGNMRFYSRELHFGLYDNREYMLRLIRQQFPAPQPKPVFIGTTIVPFVNTWCGD